MTKQEHKKAAMDDALKEIQKCKEKRSSKLEIGYNGYLDIFPDEIRELTWLKSLSVICTDISIVPDWIGELTNLKILDLSTNHKIKELPKSISNLKNLKILILSNTRLNIIPSIIGKMQSLEYLDISICGLIEVPECVLDLPNLKRIETKGYDIGHIPKLVERQNELNINEAFRRIEDCKRKKRKILDLSFLYLSELPEEISNLSWIEELILKCNCLKCLPEWIGSLSELSSLDLYSNELGILPDCIGNLKKLKSIDISENRIETLPESFGSLISLEYFNLREEHNHPALEEKEGQGSWFATIPESFGNLKSLKTFSVNTTRLKGLPDSFGNLKSLEKFSIQESITDDFYFPPSMKNLTSLQEVSIGGIGHVPDFISGLKDLESLDISHNKLETLPSFIGSLTKLKVLNLHSTWITELPEWLENLNALEDLDISSNCFTQNIDEVYEELYRRLPRLKEN